MLREFPKGAHVVFNAFNGLRRDDFDGPVAEVVGLASARFGKQTAVARDESRERAGMELQDVTGLFLPELRACENTVAPQAGAGFWCAYIPGAGQCAEATLLGMERVLFCWMHQFCVA